MTEALNLTGSRNENGEKTYTFLAYLYWVVSSKRGNITAQKVTNYKELKAPWLRETRKLKAMINKMGKQINLLFAQRLE